LQEKKDFFCPAYDAPSALNTQWKTQKKRRKLKAGQNLPKSRQIPG